VYEIDVSVRFEALGADFLVLVECKHQKRPVERERVQVLLDRIREVWSAPGSMDNRIDGCTMKPEVTFEHRKEATQSLYA
jgi:hypothetical protein